MLKVQIVEGHHEVQSRSGKPDSDGVVKKYFHQFGYAHLPDSMYPQKIKVPIDTPAEAYPVGEYFLSNKSFQVGRFDSLEINGFNLVLDKANK